MSPKRVLVFDRYRLDEEERQLLRDSEPIPITPKLFDLLVELVGNAGHLLRKEYLLDKLWPDVAVEEGSLTRSMSSLRQLLGSTADGRDFIQTVSRRGYRFIAAVRKTTTDELDGTGTAGRIPLALPVASSGVDFVGRDSELLRMDEVWQHVSSGRHELVLIAGEPGIGKTRLSLEFAGIRGAEGHTVLLGYSDEENLVPFQPFVQSLSWYVRHCPEADLRAQLTAIGGGGELVPFLPELRSRIPDLPSSMPVDSKGQRYRVFESVDALLAVASRARPMLFIFDDLHWADKSTLMLLRHVARSARTGRFCIVATYRESELGRTHPLAEVLLALRREARVTRLVLRGLDLAGVMALVEGIVGSDAPASLARMVMDSTDGNPFFVTETLHHLKETGALRGESRRNERTIEVGDLGLSEGIRELIGRRLYRLSEACTRVLGIASIIGREFDVTLLEAVAELPDSELLDALEEATHAQLISESRERKGGFRFSHALIRETVYSQLSAPRRVKLHLRVGEAFERLKPNMREPPLAELAYHFSEAASTGAVGKAIDYAIRAGDRAIEGLAHEEAARLFDMALQSLAVSPAGTDTARVRVDLHLRRARCFDALGQWPSEVRELQAALRLLPSHQIERRCELMLDVARASFLLLDVRPVEQYASDALQLAERLQRSDLAANAIAWLARCRQAHGDLDAAIDMDRTAISRAPKRATAAYMLGPLTLYLAGRSPEAIPLAIQAADAARSSGDTTFIMYALSHIGLNMMATGRYDEASKAFFEVRGFGRKYGAHPMLARATAMAGGLHLMVFDFEGAEALQTEARELGRSVGFTPSIVSAGIDLLLTFARRHEPGRVERVLQETAVAAASTADWHQWLWQLRLTQAKAELALERGAIEEAIATASESIEQSRVRRRPKYEALGLITRARGLQWRARTHEAIDDARTALHVADKTGDPALTLLALDAVIGLEATDELTRRARAVANRINDSLPDEQMRRCFAESEVVRRLRGGGNR